MCPQHRIWSSKTWFRWHPFLLKMLSISLRIEVRSLKWFLGKACRIWLPLCLGFPHPHRSSSMGPWMTWVCLLVSALGVLCISLKCTSLDPCMAWSLLSSGLYKVAIFSVRPSLATLSRQLLILLNPPSHLDISLSVGVLHTFLTVCLPYCIVWSFFLNSVLS